MRPTPHVTIGHVMSTDVATVRRDASVSVARDRMRARGVRHLVVTDGTKVAGVVSERDLRAVRPGEDQRRSIADVMPRDFVAVSASSRLPAAAALMRGRGIGCLPVLDRGDLVGIVTTSDLLTLLAAGLPTARRRGRRVVRGTLPSTPRA